MYDNLSFSIWNNPLNSFEMELRFVKVDNMFVAEFEAAGDFNLHIERSEGGLFMVEQRTSSEGKYARVANLCYQGGIEVVDQDFVGAVYPKYIKVSSEVDPTLAIVTFNE